MILSARDKTILGSGAALVIIALVLQYSGFLVPFNTAGEAKPSNINITLLTNAGIMIETGSARIYIDPIDLPQKYHDKPADAVLITHDHGDHYQYVSVNMIQKEGTLNVFPAIMTSEVARHNGVGLVPGDEVMVGDIKVKAYYMYTFSPDRTTAASHPKANQYTSYIVDINGFTIFHSGDSKNIPEYTDLTGMINVACLPLGPGCQTMCDTETVDVVRVIKPDYMIPIHYTADSYRTFNAVYKRSVESSTECEVYMLEEYSTHSFETL